MTLRERTRSCGRRPAGWPTRSAATGAWSSWPGRPASAGPRSRSGSRPTPAGRSGSPSAAATAPPPRRRWGRWWRCCRSCRTGPGRPAPPATRSSRTWWPPCAGRRPPRRTCSSSRTPTGPTSPHRTCCCTCPAGSTCRALVLVTYRPEDVGAGHLLRRVLGDAATAAGTRRLDLGPLSPAAVGALAADRPGVDRPTCTAGPGTTRSSSPRCSPPGRGPSATPSRPGRPGCPSRPGTPWTSSRWPAPGCPCSARCSATAWPPWTSRSSAACCWWPAAGAPRGRRGRRPGRTRPG